LLTPKIIEELGVFLKKKFYLQVANAAVCLLLKPAVEDYEILFVKRVKRQSDPWSGQIAFPGGKRDLVDRNLKDTIIREVFEETNIKLKENNFVGALKIIDSELNRNFKILPFIALLKKNPRIELNKNELESYFWISYDDFNRSKGNAGFGNKRVPAYIFGENIVWGVTYNILEMFCNYIESIVKMKN